MKRPVKRHEVIQPLDQSYRLIPLTQGQNAIVDVEDFDRLSQWNWHARWNKCTKSFYAIRYERTAIGHRRRVASMANEVLGCLEEVDHRNHNTLDHRRDNLRKCTRIQNMQNQGLSAKNKSGFKGVSWRKELGNWRARIQTNGKEITIGCFPSAEEGARAYDEAARKYHGEFAHLNFP